MASEAMYGAWRDRPVARGGEFFVGLFWIGAEGRVARGLEAVELTERAVAVGADVLWIGEGRDSLEDVFLDRVDEDVEAGTR